MANTSSNMMEDLVLKAPTPDATRRAAANIKKAGAVRTPLVKLNWRRSDLPDLEIFLKLETLQPINSFKIRGAANKLASVDRNTLRSEFGDCVVSASAGNMGQGVAFAARSLGCECVIVVPDHAPANKLEAMDSMGARIVKVPYSRWWEVLQTGDAFAEIGKPHFFVHPVCDPDVVAGNSTLGLEILEDLPDVDAVFCAYGGGGCCGGIGSALRNAGELIPDWGPGGDAPTPSTKKRRIDMVSVEPATAAPMCASFNAGEVTPFPNWTASWIDGCGGKSVLKPMWPLAQEVLTHAMKVELGEVELALRTLVEKNRVVAEGAGACSVAAVMLAPLAQMRAYRKVVAVVCGGCIDTAVLTRILASGTTSSSASGENTEAATVVSPGRPLALGPLPRALSASDVQKALPMATCIDAAEAALIAYASGEGRMPLRSVFKLGPFAEDPQKLGFLGTMPSFCGEYAACKCITVFPGNASDERFSSHQGQVLLWNAGGNGELLLSADAHEITSIRTAAASAAATRLMLSRELSPCGMDRASAAEVLALVGTGAQARSHFEALRLVLPNLKEVRIAGRNFSKAQRLAKELEEASSLRSQGPCLKVKVTPCETVEICVSPADVVCTLTSAREPIVFDRFLKAGCHINAVGACQPQFRELDCDVFAGAGCVLTDSVEACLSEPGDVLDYLRSREQPREGSAAAAAAGLVKERFVSIGGAFGEGDSARQLRDRVRVVKNEAGATPRYTLFYSLGIALEDLFAAKVIWESL